MVGDLGTVPLAALTRESRNLLSDLLNPKKVLPIVGPDQLSRHRDWRGLASLLDITTEQAASINEHSNKTARVLDIWEERLDGTATIGRLLGYLQILDRYDAYDDILERHRDNRLIAVQNNALDVKQFIDAVNASDEELITFDDKLFGQPRMYHSYLLSSEQDKPFVDELLYRMRSQGFEICTEEDLRPGYATKFEPVSRLMTERCRYVILVLSPDFFKSPANTFSMNLAQADAINKKQIKIIPIMYRQCTLPSHIAHYHSLRYHVTRPYERYNFWDKLTQSLQIADMPRINGTSNSCVNIAEISRSLRNGYTQPTRYSNNCLALPDVPKDSSSLNDLRHVDIPKSYETRSLSNSSQSSEGKKKKSGTIRKIFETFRGKKHKKAIAVEN